MSAPLVNVKGHIVQVVDKSKQRNSTNSTSSVSENIPLSPTKNDSSQIVTNDETKTPESPSIQKATSNPKCNQCKEASDGKSITCFNCEQLVHYECSGMSKRDCDFLKKKQQTALKFVCPTCIKNIELGKAKNSGGNPQNIEERVDDLGQIVRPVLEQNKNLIEQNSKIL